MLRKLYDGLILSYPRATLVLVMVIIALLGFQARKLDIDASAETLLLEDDKDLALTREINSRFETSDFLFITYKPKVSLLADETLDNIRRLKEDLLKLERVESVISILDVPLLQSPPRPVKEVVKDTLTLESEGVDKELAKKEFLTSPLYQKMLVNPDFTITALQVNLHQDKRWQEFINRRNALRQKEKDGSITPAEVEELKHVISDFKAHRNRMRDIESRNIMEVRKIMEKYSGDAELFLGGPSMIADDLITFIKNDLKIFGLGVFVLLIITLWLIFRQFRWLLLPVLCCSLSVLTTCGLLGVFGWEVTVISSNFMSIQLIITMAITIHLIVRYRELAISDPTADQRQLTLETVLFMAKPCLFAILTTVAGFSSLMFSGILPVVNFGWMMSAGIGVSLILTFLIFPTVLVQMEKATPKSVFATRFAITKLTARLTEKRGNAILLITAVLLVLCVYGAFQLKVENAFIDYFKKSTEIYQGMKLIDQQLGGTTPLDVVIDLPEEKLDIAPADSAAKIENEDEFDAFEEEFEEEKNKAQYWFTAEKMARVEKVHDYLDSLPGTGKVMSLGTMLKVGKIMNDGEPLDNFMLALIYNELPERFRKIILNPYVSVENNQARFSIRILDSKPDLRRDELLRQIRGDLTGKLGTKRENVHLAGLMVLYNNMLQSLFDSQIKTLGAVIVVLMLMFLVLFRSIRISFIAIFPNILSVGVVLGFMGLAGIPLDMMTITIAAISVGIAVDDTIHYIHRFKSEFQKDRDYMAAMHRCHESIGYAMYYTSVTIIIGFSILVLSNFIPGIYFGILTCVAMAIALIAALTLLPRLIILIKPYGPEATSV